MVLSLSILRKDEVRRSYFSFRQRSGMLDFQRSIAVPAKPVSRPTGTGIFAGVALGMAMFSTTGCLFQKKHARPFVPPMVKRVDPATLKPPPITDPANLQTETVAASMHLPDLLSESIQLTPPPAPPPPPPTKPVIAGPKPAPPPPTSLPGPTPPKIVQLFSADQQRGFNRELDDILERDQKELDTLAKKNLSVGDRDRITQIRELLAQARQARDQDLVTAVNLARHADTLAKDLVERLP
jgi:hypothetical protein